MKNFGIIIFDMDGTLVESMELYLFAFCQVLASANGVSFDLSREVFESTAGLPLDEQFQLALEKSGITSNYDLNALIQSFWQVAGEADARVVPDAPGTLRKLASAGYTLIVSSGSIPAVVANRAKKANIAQYFRLLLGTDYGHSREMVKGKGHFEIIQRELSITPSLFRNIAIMVGDGPHDITIAKNAGIRSIAKLTAVNQERMRQTKADFYITELSQIITLLSKPLQNPPVFCPISDLVAPHSKR